MSKEEKKKKTPKALESKVPEVAEKREEVDISKLNLYEKMDLARVEIGIVAKNIAVMNSYKAVSESDVIKAVNEAEHKARLVSFQESLEILNSQMINQTIILRVKVGIRLVNIDNPEESVVFYGIGDGIDKGDKACGKAVTYATKYALMRGYKIPTGEDPDYFKSEEGSLPEEMATEEDIAEYTTLIGGEKNVPYVCKMLGVKSFAELTRTRILDRIEKAQRKLKEREERKNDKN